MIDAWEDRGTYWLHKCPQRSPGWIQERQCRLTGTGFSSIVNPSFYSGPDDIITKYTNSTIQRSFQDSLAMRHGVRNESKGRDWYCQRTGQSVTEIGLAVPKWEPRIGCSVDGEVDQTNGIIEIKCPGRMYTQICRLLTDQKNGHRPEWSRHHILDSHYDQMQGGMAILNKDWCDYIVYSLPEEKVFLDRVYFDPRYWDQTMFPKIQEFLDAHPNIFNGSEPKILYRRSDDESKQIPDYSPVDIVK